MLRIRRTQTLLEGMERGEGKFSPGEGMNMPTTKDPGFARRKQTIVTCNGYVDPRDGKTKVAPGHKAKEVVFTQDAPQTHRCDACQTAYRSAYKMAHAANAANKGSKQIFG